MSQDLAAQSGTPAAAVEAAADTPEHGLFARLAAEAFGTFVLVLGIVGTATFNAANNGQILPVALAGGILVMAAIAAVGGVSGGHFNPAVTFGMALAGRTPWRDVAPYWVAQLIGGTAAAAVMFSVIPSQLPALLNLESKAALFATTANGFGSHSPLATLTASSGSPAEFTLWAALLVEVVVTAVFVGVILAVTSKRSSVTYAPAVIGLTLGAMLVVAWPVTNASLNPARSFASAIFAGGWTWGQLWLFIVAPLLGGALAALFYRAFAPVPVGDQALVGSAAGDDLGVRFGDDLTDDVDDAAGTQHDVVDDGALQEDPLAQVADAEPEVAADIDDTSADESGDETEDKGEDGAPKA